MNEMLEKLLWAAVQKDGLGLQSRSVSELVGAKGGGELRNQRGGGGLAAWRRR